MEPKTAKTAWREKDIKQFKSIRDCITGNSKELSLRQRLQAKESFSEHLSEPEKEELPRILELKQDGFYDGDIAKDCRECSSGILRHKKKELSGNLIDMNQLFVPYPGGKDSRRLSKRGMRVTVVGPAGSGKTTIIGRFAREAAKGNIDQMKEEGFLVHQINCRELYAKKEISVAEFLFKTMLGKYALDKHDMELGFRWMQENPGKTVLIIDSLDTMGFRLEKVKQEVGHDGVATPDVILHSLLTGKLLGESFVLTSSREYKIKDYTGPLRADKVVSLVGLTETSIRSLTIGFLGKEEGEKVFRKLEECPQLKELCETPVLLIFTIIGLKQKEEVSAFVPKSMAGVLVNLVNCLSRSQHARTRERFSDEEFIAAINKMKELAYNGMKDDKVVYNAEDLENAELTEEEVSDLVLVIPGKVAKFQQILEKGFVSFFVHQTVGELLCALKICEMDLEEFRQFVFNDLHQRKHSVIRQLICGILLDDEIFKEASELLLQRKTDFEEKRKILKESLTLQFYELTREDDRQGLLDLLHAVHEAGNRVEEIMPSDIDTISLSYQPLMVSDMLAVAGSVCRSSHLNRLALLDCRVFQETVQVLHDKLQDSDLKVTELDVSENGSMGTKGLALLGRVVRRHEVDKLGLESCEIQEEELEALCEGMGEAKLKEVSIWQYLPLPIQAICKLQSKVTELINLKDNRLSLEDESLLQKRLNELYPTNLKIIVGGYDSPLNVRILRSVEKLSHAGSQPGEDGKDAGKEDVGDFKSGFDKLEKECEIGPNGGAISLEEATLIVHETPSPEPLNVTLSMSMNFRNLGLGLPKDQIPISPVMGVKLLGRRPVRSTMKAPTWFQKCNPNMILRVYKGVTIDGLRVWSEFQTDVKLGDGLVEFEVSHFCYFLVTVWRYFWGTGHILLSHTLLSKGENFRSIVCYQKPKALMEDRVKECKDEGFKWIHRGDFAMSTAQNTRVPVKIETEQNIYPFYPVSKFVEPKYFINGVCALPLTFIMEGLAADPPKRVKIHYKVDDQDAVMMVELFPEHSPQIIEATCNFHDCVIDNVAIGVGRMTTSSQ